MKGWPTCPKTTIFMLHWSNNALFFILNCCPIWGHFPNNNSLPYSPPVVCSPNMPLAISLYTLPTDITFCMHSLCHNFCLSSWLTGHLPLRTHFLSLCGSRGIGSRWGEPTCCMVSGMFETSTFDENDDGILMRRMSHRRKKLLCKVRINKRRKIITKDVFCTSETKKNTKQTKQQT